MIIYSFLKNMTTGSFKYPKIFANFQVLSLYLRKTKNVQILYKASVQKFHATFFRKNCII